MTVYQGERSGGWRQREDVLAWAASMMFVGVLIAMVYVVGEIILL